MEEQAGVFLMKQKIDNQLSKSSFHDYVGGNQINNYITAAANRNAGLLLRERRI